MNKHIKYTIYTNLFKYIDIIGFVPIGENNEPVKKTKETFTKTMQFYSYVFIKAKAKSDPSDIMYTFVIGDNSYVSKSLEFKKLLNIIHEKKLRLNIVSQNGMKTIVKKFLQNYDNKQMQVKNLLYDNFKVDVRNNVMVPKHSICTKEETKQIMEDNGLANMDMFPRIKSIDPQVLWTGGIPGQLMKIMRRDVTGEVPYYRIITP